MTYEIITVNEYYGNNFCSSKQAKLFEDGRLEYLPEPEPEDDGEVEEDGERQT